MAGSMPVPERGQHRIIGVDRLKLTEALATEAVKATASSHPNFIFARGVRTLGGARSQLRNIRKESVGRD